MSDWQPIETAPDSFAVFIGNDRRWTLARRVLVPTSTLQLRWPFVVNSEEWRWVFSCTRFLPVNFEPTHWKCTDMEPPES